MRVVQLTRPGLFEVVEKVKPVPGPGEALVAVKRIGVCGTDWHAFAGRQPFFEYPRVLGHELGVQVLALGGQESGGVTVGDACAVEPYFNNPASQASRLGKTHCCEELKVLGVHMDGGMCPYLVIPTHKLHPSKSLNFDQLALVETLCIGAHAVERAQIEARDRVLVLGAGPIGLSVAAFASRQCARVVMADVDQERLAFVSETQPGVRCVDAANPEMFASVVETLGDIPSVVLDATGNRDSMERSLKLAANGGRVVLVGLFQGSLSFDDPEFHRKELTLMASRNAPSSTFKRVIEALENEEFDIDVWITERLALEEVPSRMGDLAGQKNRIKAMITSGE